MSPSCPVTFRRLDEHAARLTALLVVGVACAFVASGAAWVAFALAVDFALRGFGLPRFSPLAGISRFVLATLKVDPKPVDAGPKTFAAKVGFAMSLIAAALAAIGMPTAAAVVAVMLASCAALEAALGFCVGCQIYARLPSAWRRSAAVGLMQP